MKRTIGALRVAAVLGGALALSGCGLFGGKVDQGMSAEMKQKCPPVGIVAYTGQVTRFAGLGRLAQDVALRAEITNLKVSCVNSEDKGAVNARITFDVVAERGPASTDSGASLQYFVAITPDSKTVARKDVYDSNHSFGANGISTSTETIDAVVPLKGEEIPYEEILIGLQLTREELGYNIARAGVR